MRAFVKAGSLAIPLTLALSRLRERGLFSPDARQVSTYAACGRRRFPVLFAKMCRYLCGIGKDWYYLQRKFALYQRMRKPGWFQHIEPGKDDQDTMPGNA